MNAEALKIYLEAGFIDLDTAGYKEKRNDKFLPKILTNNQEKQVKVLESLLYELDKADDFFFSVAFITNSGIACLIDTLKNLQNKNIRGKILASQYQNFTEPRALRRLLEFPNLELKIITSDYNFHAKGYLFHTQANTNQEDNYTMIIGSSNLTQSALTINREWNVQLSSMKNGALIKQMQAELEKAWEDATTVTEAWIQEYEKIYNASKSARYGVKNKVIQLYKINPNKMQVEALRGIEALRLAGKKRALLISATGTGKTFLSAFDVRKIQPKRCLFIVHRALIARKSKESFEKIIDKNISTGLFTGAYKNLHADYLFATVQTLAIDENLHSFKSDEFDYIIIDEVHHAGAQTYQKILNYFKPKFLLGMTATPERTDGYDIFKDFDYNIAYEIRLNQALSENMLVPFHYHGISEITIDGEVLDEYSDFNRLVREERVRHILTYADFYGCDQGRVKGLVFCSRTEEAEALCRLFNKYGKRSSVITGTTRELERKAIISRLEIEDYADENALDYIFSVDVLNEGVDIPSVNQVIMLRPTESAIVFVQQLGRGLRKNPQKRYLEVIDFIGNYENNYLLPIALYGDRSYNKDKIKRILHNNFLPGASTVYLEDVVKERIFKSLNDNNFTELRALKESYKLVEFKLGHAPMMMDFIKLGDKDPYLFVQKKKSYYNFKQYAENSSSTLNSLQIKLLEFVGLEIATGKSIEEVLLLKYLLEQKQCSVEDFIKVLENAYNIPTDEKRILSAINILQMKFFKDADRIKYGNLALVELKDSTITLSSDLGKLCQNTEFEEYLLDSLEYGIYTFLSDYDAKNYYHGFKLYSTYTRKDACRILNWEKDESSTVYGYRVKYSTCPIFVTYEKSDDISATTNYEDNFIDQYHFHWWTRNKVKLDSAEVIEIEKKETLKLLFIKKSDADGSDFYFMGTMTHGKSIGTSRNINGKKDSIVEMFYIMDMPVDHKIYDYFEQ